MRLKKLISAATKPGFWATLGFGCLTGVFWARLGAAMANVVATTGCVLILVATVLFLVRRKRPLRDLILGGAAVALLLGFTSYKVLWVPSTHLGVFAMTGTSNYAPGTSIAGIKWAPQYREIRLFLANTSDRNCEDIDLVITPDQAIAAAGFVSAPSSAVLKHHRNTSARFDVIDNTNRKLASWPLEVIATSAGYRMQCEMLPARTRIEIAFAAVRVVSVSSAATIEHRDYWFAAPMSSGGMIWLGSPGHSDSVFELPPPVKSIRVTGVLRAEGRRNKMSVEVQAVDPIEAVIAR